MLVLDKFARLAPDSGVGVLQRIPSRGFESRPADVAPPVGKGLRRINPDSGGNRVPVGEPGGLV